MATLLEIVAVVVTYLVVALFGMRVLARLGFITAKGGANVAAGTPLIAAALVNVVTAVLVVVEHLGFGGTLADLRAGFGAPDVGWALLGGALLILVAASWARLLGATRVTPSAGGGLTALLVLALFCGALMEEVVFRAIIIGALMPLGVWAALVIAAIIFTLIHIPTSQVTVEALIGWMMGGLMLGGAWVAGAPLVVVTLFHLAHNVGNPLWVKPAAQFGRVKVPDTSPAPRLARYVVDAVIVVGIAVIGYQWL